ncbi:hypothetical protein [Desertibaculum subflavum]|uniref:hypothetical protein n=1 Tax=Desertibaculum subflavum TaxID=2268458 RepID=UPI0013C4AEAA
MTSRTAVVAALTMVVGVVAPAPAMDTRPLSGTYAIGSATLVDPPPGESKDRVLFYIDGAAAKEIYDAMQAEARPSACDPSLRSKTAGMLECSRGPGGDYECSIGVLLTKGTSVRASVC